MSLSIYGKEPPKISNFKLAEALEGIIEVVPMVEAQRNTIKEAADRLRYLDD